MRRCAAWLLLGACRFAFDDHAIDAPVGDGPRDTTALDAKPVCPTAALLCDDFESGNLTKWTGAYPAGASAVVDNDKPRSGSFGLDSHVPAAMTSGGEAQAILTVAPHDLLSTRAWFYLPDPIESFEGVIYYVDLPDETHYLEVTTDDSGWGATGHASALMDYTSNVPNVTQTWTCIELEVDRPGKHMKLYIDDALAIDSALNDADPQFTTIGVGASRANAGGFHVYADDVVIATSHVGCN